MARKLSKQTSLAIREFLAPRPHMTHIIAVECLKDIGISVSMRTVLATRKLYEIPYIKDARIHNTVMQARDKGTPITDAYLKWKLPQICAEHRAYLVAKFEVKPERKELPPVRVGGIAHVVHQILLAA